MRPTWLNHSTWFCFSKNIDVYLWMGPLRRQLDHSISFRGQPRPEDIEELSKEVITFIIRVLQSHVDKQVGLALQNILSDFWFCRTI